MNLFKTQYHWPKANTPGNNTPLHGDGTNALKGNTEKANTMSRSKEGMN